MFQNIGMNKENQQLQKYCFIVFIALEFVPVKQLPLLELGQASLSRGHDMKLREEISESVVTRQYPGFDARVSEFRLGSALSHKAPSGQG